MGAFSLDNTSVDTGPLVLSLSESSILLLDDDRGQRKPDNTRDVLGDSGTEDCVGKPDLCDSQYHQHQVTGRYFSDFFADHILLLSIILISS